MRTNGKDYRSARLQGVLQRAENYDVLCLQEYYQCWTNMRMEKLFRQQLKQLGFSYQMHGPTINSNPLRVASGGCFIASKYPIVEKEKIEFKKRCINDDFMAHKGFLYAKLNCNGKFLHIINCHLQASYYDQQLTEDEQKKDKYIAIRLIQLQQIQDFISDRELQQSGPVILTGDFNVDTFSSPFTHEGDNIQSLQNQRIVSVLDRETGKFSGACFDQDQPNLGSPDHLSYEYQELRKIIKGEDVVLESYGGLVPATICTAEVENGKLVPYDTLLIEKQYRCICQRLDYVFYYKFEGFKCTAKVNKFQYQCQKYPELKCLSDHFGHDIELTI